MHSEKLKQLVKAKTPLKFRIKDSQQSKELQEFFFTLDVPWFISGKNIQNYFKFFLIDSGGYPFRYTISGSNDEKMFEKEDGKEFDLENDCLVEECKWPNLKKLVLDETPLKFRIKDEQQSKELQEFFFTLDVYWIDGDRNRNLSQLKSDSLFLGGEDKYVISICNSGINCLACHPRPKEFDLENDCLVEEIKRIDPENVPSHEFALFKIVENLRKDLLKWRK